MQDRGGGKLWAWRCAGRKGKESCLHGEGATRPRPQEPGSWWRLREAEWLAGSALVMGVLTCGANHTKCSLTESLPPLRACHALSYLDHV